MLNCKPLPLKIEVRIEFRGRNSEQHMWKK